MKRLWISLGILAAIFALSLCNIHCASLASNQLVTLLNHAEEAAESGRWMDAAAWTEQAQDAWDAYAPLVYITACHSNADTVNTGFREVLELLQQQAAEEYSAANGVLIAQLEHLAEVEQLSLANLL